LVDLRTCIKEDERVRDATERNTRSGKQQRQKLLGQWFVHIYFSRVPALNSKLIKVAESKPPASARIRQATWSFGASFLKGLDLRALVSLTQYSGKPSRAEGTRPEQQILKNLPFHPVNEFWKGDRRTLPGTLLRVTQRLFLCLFTSKK